jgi:hypothetical protein
VHLDDLHVEVLITVLEAWEICRLPSIDGLVDVGTAIRATPQPTIKSRLRPAPPGVIDGSTEEVLLVADKAASWEINARADDVPAAITAWRRGAAYAVGISMAAAIVDRCCAGLSRRRVDRRWFAFLRAGDCENQKGDHEYVRWSHQCTAGSPEWK